MILQIKDYLPISIVDYPPYIATTVFLQGCNFNCKYCFNRSLIPIINLGEENKYIEFKEYLHQNAKYLDAIVFSGGEPLLQYEALLFFLYFIKRNYSLRIKIFTNGYFYNELKFLIQNNLIDCVALDIKALPADYKKMTGVEFNPLLVLDIVKLAPEYEIRAPSFLRDKLSLPNIVINYYEIQKNLQRYLHSQ